MTLSVDEAKPATADPTVLDVALDEDEAHTVEQLARELMDTFTSPHDLALFTELDAVAGAMPLTARRLAARARLGEQVGAVVFRGIPVHDGQIGPTPENWQSADTPASRLYAFEALLFGALLGDPIGWQAQQRGRIVTDIVPTQGMEESLVSSSSTKELGWHTEDAFSPHRADWVGLFCLRNPGSVATTVAGVELDAVPAAIREVLSQPRFYIRPDSAHEVTDTSELAPRALLTSDDEGAVLRADRDFVEPVEGDDQAVHAFQWLVDHLNSRLYDLVLRPGEMGFINNRVVVHGRRAFVPRFESARERWLKRVNIVRDVRVTRSGRASTAERAILAS